MQVDVIVVFHMCGPALPFLSRCGAARPDTVRATPDLAYPFLEPTYSPAHPSSATNATPRFFLQLPTSVQQTLILSFNLYRALRIAHTISLVQALITSYDYL